MKNNLHSLLKEQGVNIPDELNDSALVQTQIKYLEDYMKVKADAEEKARADAEEKARADAEEKTRADAEAKAMADAVLKNRQNNWATMQTADFKPIIIEYIVDFIEAVDNSNAVSAVGTIEFIDRLSKLNTVATICDANEDNKTKLIEQFKPAVLLPIPNKTRGGTRRTGKHAVKRTKKRRPVSI